MLRASAVSLLIAIVAAVFAFGDGSAGVLGAAKVVSFLFTACFVILAGVGLYAKRRSD